MQMDRTHDGIFKCFGQRREKLERRLRSVALILRLSDHGRCSIREITQANSLVSAYDRPTSMHMKNELYSEERGEAEDFPEVSQLTGRRVATVPYREIAGDTQWNSRACVNRMILLCISNILQNNKISSQVPFIARYTYIYNTYNVLINANERSANSNSYADATIVLWMFLCSSLFSFSYFLSLIT